MTRTLTEHERLKDPLRITRPSREANLTIRILRREYSFGGKREEAWRKLQDRMKVRDWCDICKPIFNDTSAGTYLLALYLEKELIALVP